MNVIVNVKAQLLFELAYYDVAVHIVAITPRGLLRQMFTLYGYEKR